MLDVHQRDAGWDVELRDRVVGDAVEVLDQRALLAINDLGPNGETWTLNSISCDRGRIYHRSLKELVCIGSSKGAAK